MNTTTATKRVYKRYWWWHPKYVEAQFYGYRCFKPWLPYVKLTVGFRYFVQGVEVTSITDMRPKHETD